MGGTNLKRVLIVENSKYRTGAFHSVRSFSTALGQEFDFYYAVPRGCWQNEPGISDNNLLLMNYYELGKNIGALLYLPRLIINSLKLLKLVHKHSIEIIHVSDVYNMIGVCLKIMDRNLGLVYHVRLLKSSYVKVLYSFWILLISKFADHIICVSNAVARNVNLPFKAEVLYNCISNETPVPRPVKHIKRNYVELLYVGNYIQGKGQDLALISLNKALKKNPNIRLKFIGGDLGRKKNQAFFKTLCVIVERWNLKDKVQFCGPSNNINKEMQACDIVINFSESESFSMVCLEALSCGAPLIASRSGGPEEIIRHKVNGLLVENRNTEEMAEAITQLASNELLRLEFSRNARLDFEQKFNLERMTNRLKDIYQSSRTLKN